MHVNHFLVKLRFLIFSLKHRGTVNYSGAFWCTPNPGGGVEGGWLKPYAKCNVFAKQLWEAAFT